jgi:hypothetical protein
MADREGSPVVGWPDEHDGDVDKSDWPRPDDVERIFALLFPRRFLIGVSAVFLPKEKAPATSACSVRPSFCFYFIFSG